MNFLISFLIDNWASVSVVIAAIGLRLFPTEKNYDIFQKILKLLDLIIPNIKKGGGRHAAKLILFFVLVSVSVESFAQLNTRTRQIRFANGVQHATDTAETVANTGRIWYDFETDRYRANFNGNNDFFGYGSGGSVGNFWPLSGEGEITGDVTITGDGTHDLNFHPFLGGPAFNQISMPATSDINIESGSNVFVSGSSSASFSGPIGAYTLNTLSNFFTGMHVYNADYSAEFVDRSIIDKAYADTKIDGAISSNQVVYGVDANTATSSSDFTFSSGINALGIGETAGISQSGFATVHGTNAAGVNHNIQLMARTLSSVATTSIVSDNAPLSIHTEAGYTSRFQTDSLSIFSVSGSTEGITFSSDVGGTNFSRISFKDGTNRIGFIDYQSSTNSLMIGRGGQNIIKINNNNEVVFVSLQTNCTGAESGSVWNDAGTLKICP